MFLFPRRLLPGAELETSRVAFERLLASVKAIYNASPVAVGRERWRRRQGGTLTTNGLPRLALDT